MVGFPCQSFTGVVCAWNIFMMATSKEPFSPFFPDGEISLPISHFSPNVTVWHQKKLNLPIWDCETADSGGDGPDARESLFVFHIIVNFSSPSFLLLLLCVCDYATRGYTKPTHSNYGFPVKRKRKQCARITVSGRLANMNGIRYARWIFASSGQKTATKKGGGRKQYWFEISWR